MKLSHIAVLSVALVGLLLGTLYLLQPDKGSGIGAEGESASWNQPNKEFPNEFPTLHDFFVLLHEDPTAVRQGLNNIVQKWQPGNAIMLLELSRWLKQTPVEPLLTKLLVEKLPVGEFDSDRIYGIIWSEDVQPHPQYADFKKRLFSQLDPRFAEYFDDSYPATIRLDEIRWGGVRRDGIPPLVDPKMLSADQADYLDDSNIVFGLEINGDARAYPKRILAWHELFRDTVGEIPVAGVYCTLCGTVIIYDETMSGGRYDLGTSGFLYRSNKLMYDQATRSLWSTLKGQPVVGPLVGKGIVLPRHEVVTTTWGKWKAMHPDTRVLSLETGHERNYDEGVAYAEYFETDELMFNVPATDSRLKNKDEVLALRNEDSSQTLAISAEFLLGNPVWHDQLDGNNLVVLTDETGANRVYDSGDVQFDSWNQTDTAIDSAGTEWKITESALITEDERTLPRVAAHRAFWFGWYSAFPETRLVK
ncbi:MAG: DUF3179 domain-containing protein [Pirellulaceae bacterium]